MGGYGSLRLGFVYPELFAKVVSMSPTSDIQFAARFAYAMGINTDYILGDWKKLPGSELDLKVLAQNAAAKGVENVPDILVIIAEQDHMVRDATEFRDTVSSLGLKNDFRTYPGDHTWGFWDGHIKECLDWLGENDE